MVNGLGGCGDKSVQGPVTMPADCSKNPGALQDNWGALPVEPSIIKGWIGARSVTLTLFVVRLAEVSWPITAKVWPPNVRFVIEKSKGAIGFTGG